MRINRRALAARSVAMVNGGITPRNAADVEAIPVNLLFRGGYGFRGAQPILRTVFMLLE